MKTMKISNFPVIMTILVAFLSCSENLDVENARENNNNENCDVKEIVAQIRKFNNDYENGFTRTSIVDNGSGGMQIVWNDNDTIGIFPNQGFQVAFPMVGGAGTASASFDGGGWGLKQSSTYSAYCPLIGEFYLDKTKIPISLLGQTQESNGATAHISPYDYMCAVNSTVDEYGKVNFDFNHLVFILHTKLTMPKAGVYKYLVLESSRTLTTEGTLDLTDGSITGTTTSETITLNLNDIELSEDNQEMDLFISLFPIDLTDGVLKAKIFDSQGNIYSVNLKSRNYEAGTIYHQARTAEIECEGLPVLMINTPNWKAVDSKEKWIKNTNISILDIDGSYTSNVGRIKGRGNATWNYSKKPYAIKFEEKQSVFGFPKHKDWVLLAEYTDRSFLRTAWMAESSKAAGIDFTINYKHVNLFLNGEYKGVYLLTDKIEKSDKRVLLDDDGFLIEKDSYYAQENLYFVTTLLNKGYSFKYPDDEEDIVEGDDNFNFIVNFVNSAEETCMALENNSESTDYQNYIDEVSFIKWFIATEMIGSVDPNDYYALASRSSKLKRMPLWDAEWSFGVYPKTLTTDNNLNGLTKVVLYWNSYWYKYLHLSPTFINTLKTEWAQYKLNVDQILSRIQSLNTSISPAMQYNFNLWPYEDVPLDCNFSFASREEEIEHMITYFEMKVAYFDTFVNSL